MGTIPSKEAFFSVREAAWWDTTGDCVRPDHPDTWEQAREWAGLQWEPIPAPVYGYEGLSGDGQVVWDPAEAVTGQTVEIADKKRLVRSDTGAHLSVVGNRYEVIGNGDMGMIVESLFEQGVRYETAGAMDGGRKVFALGRLDEPVVLKGDTSAILPFVAVLSAHDGGGSYSVNSTAVRVVCQNTWHASELEARRNGTLFSFRHTKNWRDQLERAKQIVTGARSEFAEYCEAMEDLLGMPVTAEQRSLFIREFIPLPPDGLISPRVRTNVETARNKMRDLFDSETVEPVAHTAYGLVCAAGEYLDHVRKARSWETKLNRTLLGSEKLKVKALSLAREVCAA